MMTGGEAAVIAVFESEPGLAGMCPPDGVTMLHRAAQSASCGWRHGCSTTGPT